MTSDLDDIPETAAIALDWSTRPLPGEVALFISDPDLADRVDSVSQAVLDCGMTGNDEVMLDLLFVMGAIPPKTHGPILIKLGRADSAALSRNIKALSQGSESQRFAYRSLVETLGRIARHGLLIDAMGDEALVNDVRSALSRAEGATR